MTVLSKREDFRNTMTWVIYINENSDTVLVTECDLIQLLIYSVPVNQMYRIRTLLLIPLKPALIQATEVSLKIKHILKRCFGTIQEVSLRMCVCVCSCALMCACTV